MRLSDASRQGTADEVLLMQMQLEGRMNMVLDRLHSFHEASTSRFDSQAQVGASFPSWGPT